MLHSAVDAGLTVTFFVHVEVQPFKVTLDVNVKLPAAPAVTLTDCEVVDPTIEPLPLIDQL
jgi:hypothetical protein